ncbi:hypothetical protein N3K66_008149 [Trichothecium roseum]|uniref:Uncharacterized protein n=1 Tax=Trichothecium roseum TaxID=47278 RepID=A0ACC0UT53_9HYPO|nr:hypothetical protein N3K66_008149 [Trichothecium roseum]
MDNPSNSPRRRHILSSINPEDHQHSSSSWRRSRSPRSKCSSDKNGEDDGYHPAATAREETTRTVDDEYKRSRASRIKLKDHKSTRRRHRSRDRYGDDRHTSSRHRRRRRRTRSPTPPNPLDPPPLDAEAAFRESLFDAMADDEGAAYWEGVYGQPVHVYPNSKSGPDGELERMTDDEYATFVRQKMWEKTHAGLLEERAKREEERKRRKEKDKEKRKLAGEMEESLRRGEERRSRRRWNQKWKEYDEAWARWDGSSASGIAWPVESGNRTDVDPQAVRAFFVRGLDIEELGENVFTAKLREERVRWHPDKMQQKLGGKVDEEVMRGITAVFQIIDTLWGELRPKA